MLLDPALTVPPDYAQFLADEELASDGSFATVDDAIQQTFAGLFRRPPAILAEEVLEHLERGVDGRYRFRYSREAVAAAYVEVAAPPAPWQDKGVPTVIVAGSLSKFVSVGEVDVYRRGLGDRLRVIVVPGGHSVLWDAFDETADAIERFLNS